MKNRMMKFNALIGLMLAVPCLASATLVVNVNIAFGGVDDYTGLGAAPDDGANTYWNQVMLPRTQATEGVTGLTASDGFTVTSVGFNMTGHVNDLTYNNPSTPDISLFKRSLRNNQVDDGNLEITGLDDAFPHDVYIYSSIDNNGSGTMGAQFQIGAGPILDTGTSENHSTFEEGVNYVKFSNVTPTSGTIDVSLINYDPGTGGNWNPVWVVNGFQVVQIPEPSILALAAAGLAALCVARARRRG